MPSSACKKSDLRSEEHTSELQSHDNLVCRLLLENKTEPHHLRGIDRLQQLGSGLHAVDPRRMALLPLCAMCDRWDIGGFFFKLYGDPRDLPFFPSRRSPD